VRDAEPNLAPALGRWRITGEPREWADVLARAGHGAPLRRRWRPRGVLPAAAAAAALVVAPASALVLHFQTRQGSPPRAALQVSARFDTGEPVSGGLTVSAPGTFMVVQSERRSAPRIFRPVGSDRGPVRVRWRLRLDAGSARVLSARIRSGSGLRRGEELARLCAPCPSRAAGSFRLSQRRLVAVFNGRARIELRTERGTVRRVLRLERHR
jgi:hypothetical protein